MPAEDNTQGRTTKLKIATAKHGKTDVVLTPKEITWGEFCDNLSRPKVGPKDGAYYIRGGNLTEPRRADETLREADLLIIDGDSSFDPETGEVTPGAPPMSQAIGVLNDIGLTYFAHTTHSFDPAAGVWKYRIIIPAHMQNQAELEASVEWVMAQFHAKGVYLVDVNEQRKWAQPWYSPRVASEAAAADFKSHRNDGKVFDVATAVAWAWRETLAAATVERARTVQPSTPEPKQPSVITNFNDGASLADVRAMLESHGYKFAGRKGETYRYISPTSESGTAGVVIFKGKMGHWCTYSHHGAHDPLSNKVCDPFELLAMFQYGGDYKKAVRGLSPAKASTNQDFGEGQPAGSSGASNDAGSGFHADDAFAFTQADIPPRPWIVPGFLLRRAMTLLVGTGGAGKSLFSLQLGAFIAAGRDFGGFVPRKPARVLILNAEDDLQEQRRRLAGIEILTGISAADTGGRLMIPASFDGITATVSDEAGNVSTAPRILKLVEYLKHHQVDVLIVDPLAETMTGNENDVEAVRSTMRVWRDAVAKEANCAVVLVHHTPKNANAVAGDANAARGSTAINAAVRSNWTVFPMSQEDAEACGINPQDRFRYVRLDDAKANYALLSGTARWFEKCEVDIGNATFELPSDRVGVLKTWSPPGAFDKITKAQVVAAVGEIAAAFDTGQAYRFGRGVRRDAERHLLDFLMARFEVGEPVADRIAKTWMKNGVITLEEYQDDETRKLRKGVRGFPDRLTN